MVAIFVRLGLRRADCGRRVHVERTTALSTACDTTIPITTGGDNNWSVTSVGSYHGGSCARSGYIYDYETSWMEMKVVGPGTVTFWWKVSSEYGDYLEFYIDGVRKAGIDGIRAWAQSSAYQITGAGTHTLRWQYVKDGSGTENDDCGWVDYVQWSGFTPAQPPGTWQTLRYNYDHDGRRIEKKYDGQTVLTYVYDGDHCIAEYDGSGVLQRKYIYGPGVDQPVCMIEGAATCYYHFDALGSVVALSNAAGNTIQVYEYSVWGQVGASDPNHTNPFMFTARRFDKETGLYYYRARYYNPEIGRFLQTDPVGYSAGMNLYRYCSNSPLNRVDPWGLDDGDGNAPDCSRYEKALSDALKEYKTAQDATYLADLDVDSAWFRYVAAGIVVGTTAATLMATTVVATVACLAAWWSPACILAVKAVGVAAAAFASAFALGLAAEKAFDKALFIYNQKLDAEHAALAKVIEATKALENCRGAPSAL